MFQVGQMVVCVNDKLDPRWGRVTPLPFCVGGIYVVKRLTCNLWSNEPSLVLEGVPAPSGDGYLASRFRPIREQSIEIFREIARGVREPEREKV